MKAPKILIIAGIAMAIAVVALIGTVGANTSRTVGELDIALTEIETDKVIARTNSLEAVNDPSGTGYAAPLGENRTVSSGIDRSSESRVLATAVGVQGMVAGMLAVCLLIIISLVVKYWRNARSLGL